MRKQREIMTASKQTISKAYECGTKAATQELEELRDLCDSQARIIASLQKQKLSREEDYRLWVQ